MASYDNLGATELKVYRTMFGDAVEELKANMTEAITSALRTMKEESEEWEENEMVIELSA